MPDDDYSKQVFINCPFDSEYRRMFRGIVFAIIACGFVPRCTLELQETQNRLDHIVRLVEACKYGVHDLCRVELSNGLPRFNMPMELGIFLGARYLGSEKQKSK